MKFRNKLIATLVLSVFTLGITSTAFALPKLVYKAQNSQYRKIDTTGDIVGKELWDFRLKGVGVGNVIFSTSPLPVDNESAYKDVGGPFNSADVEKFLMARSYYPATLGSLVDYIIAKYPGYTYVKKWQRLTWAPPKGWAETAITNSSGPLEETAGWDQNSYPISPKSKSSFHSGYNWGEIAKNSKGKNKLGLEIYLLFDTGKSNQVTKWDDYRKAYITTDEPVLADFLIAYGECIINGKE